MLIEPPPLIDSKTDTYRWLDWFRKLHKTLTGSSGGIAWDSVDKAGSDIVDIQTRNHNSLNNIQGGAAGEYNHITNAQAAQLHASATVADTATINLSIAGQQISGDVIPGGVDHAALTNLNSASYTHLTSTNHTDLTDAGDTTLHFHSSDRARANHTGTQTISTLSDLLTLTSDVYTPTLTNVANIAASTAYQCQYMRVGSVVTVSGKADIDPTLAATSTQLGISLPVTSNLGANEDCCGTAFASGIAGQGAAILGDAANNRAQMQWISGDITNQPMYFSFTYRII